MVEEAGARLKVPLLGIGRSRSALGLALTLALLAPGLLVLRTWSCRSGSPGLACPWQPPRSPSWSEVEYLKLTLPKHSGYQSINAEDLAKSLPVWVISLKRATERRASVTEQMMKAGITNYELVDAVDGRDPSAVSYETAKQYMWGKPLHLWVKNNDWARVRLAGDLSHYKLLERAAATNTTALILEDDAVLLSPNNNFYADLLAALKELPNDWMVLYLNACYHQVGRVIGPHLAVFRAGACIWGYVVTPEFAKAVMEYVKKPQPEGFVVVDLLFDHMIQEHKVQAYIAQPALVTTSPAKSLQLDRKPSEQGLSLWDKLWVAWHSHRKLLL